MRQLPRFLLTCILFSGAVNSNSQDAINKVSLPDSTVDAEKFNSPETKLVNKDGVADAYPFISGDGLRLYFTSGREHKGLGRFFISTRKSVNEPFGEAVVLSKNLVSDFYAGSLTSDELTLCMLSRGNVYLSTRKDMQSEFSAPVLVKGLDNEHVYGPTISPDGNEIIVLSSTGKSETVRVYKRMGGPGGKDGSFSEVGQLSIPANSNPGPGQFSKDGLYYYISFGNSENEVRIWRYSRSSLNDNFVELEELPAQVNRLNRNFQPTLNADASIIVYATSQNNRWEEDDLVLVNDPGRSLATPEQFTSITKNDQHTLTVMTKLSTLQVRTYPNPFQTNIVLEMEQEPGDGTNFLLFDLSGKMIRQHRIVGKKTSIQLEGIPSATYIYQVLDGKKRLVSSGKLIRS